jgi:hypothetical protein
VVYGAGAWASIATLPISVSDEAVQAALEYGYCAECVEAARKELAATKGAYTYGEDSQGFAWSVYWENAKDAQEAFEDDAEEMKEEEE